MREKEILNLNFKKDYSKNYETHLIFYANAWLTVEKEILKNASSDIFLCCKQYHIHYNKAIHI